MLGPVGCTAQMRCGLRTYKMQRLHSGTLGMAGRVGFWFGFSFQKIVVLVAIALASRHCCFTRIKNTLSARQDSLIYCYDSFGSECRSLDEFCFRVEALFSDMLVLANFSLI